MWVPLMADAWPLKRPMRARVPAAALRVVCVRPLYARIVSWVDGKLACACPRVPAPRVPPPMANGSACPDLSGRGEAGKRTEGTPPAASAANRQPILDTAGCHVIYLRQRAGRGTGPTSDIQVHLNLHIPPGQHRCVLHGKCQHIGRDAAAGTHLLDAVARAQNHLNSSLLYLHRQLVCTVAKKQGSFCSWPLLARQRMYKPTNVGVCAAAESCAILPQSKPPPRRPSRKSHAMVGMVINWLNSCRRAARVQPIKSTSQLRHHLIITGTGSHAQVGRSTAAALLAMLQPRPGRAPRPP